MEEPCEHSGIVGRPTSLWDVGRVGRRIAELRVNKNDHLLILGTACVLSRLILITSPLFITFKTVFQRAGVTRPVTSLVNSHQDLNIAHRTSTPVLLFLICVITPVRG